MEDYKPPLSADQVIAFGQQKETNLALSRLVFFLAGIMAVAYLVMVWVFLVVGAVLYYSNLRASKAISQLSKTRSHRDASKAIEAMLMAKTATIICFGILAVGSMGVIAGGYGVGADLPEKEGPLTTTLMGDQATIDQNSQTLNHGPAIGMAPPVEIPNPDAANSSMENEVD